MNDSPEVHVVGPEHGGSAHGRTDRQTISSMRPQFLRHHVL